MDLISLIYMYTADEKNKIKTSMNIFASTVVKKKDVYMYLEIKLFLNLAFYYMTMCFVFQILYKWPPIKWHSRTNNKHCTMPISNRWSVSTLFLLMFTEFQFNLQCLFESLTCKLILFTSRLTYRLKHKHRHSFSNSDSNSKL